jgi:hypothetical protein
VSDVVVSIVEFHSYDVGGHDLEERLMIERENDLKGSEFNQCSWRKQTTTPMT